MAAWVKEEEDASEHRERKKEEEEADKVEVAPGVTVASLRRFRAALIGPTQRLPKRRRLCPWLRSEEGIGWLAAGTILNYFYRVRFFYLFLACALCLKKNQNAPRPSEHSPDRGKNG